MSVRARVGLLVVWCCLGLPALALAQATITGAVHDGSGGVLPGVTVEAASPALIEKTRSVVTDGTGQYRLVDLRPGTYTLTFTLPGFNTVKREGVELSGSFTATINAEMRVGDLQETITVTGQAPTVDVQSATRQRVITAEVVDTVPTGRLVTNLAVLIPGVTPTNATGGRNQDVGGALGSLMVALTVHGSRPGDQRITYNGISLGTFAQSGSTSFAVPNMQAFQEVTVDFAAVSAEMATSGVRINMIPKDGGNQIKGTVFGSFANDAMQGSNFTDRVKKLGLASPDSLLRVWDFNPGVGGPIAKDRVWFYTTVRNNGNWNNAANIFANKNANNPNAWVYEPDLTKPGVNRSKWQDVQARITAQLSERNKVGVIYDYQTACTCPFGVSSTRAPETSVRRRSPTQPQYTADWSSPLTNRLLLDAVASRRFERYGNSAPFDLNPDMISVTEQSTGLQYRALPTYTNNYITSLYYRFGVAYVTGAHALKIGMNDGFGSAVNGTRLATPPVSYRFNNGVPNQITLQAAPVTTRIDVDHDLGLYVQDKWTRDRATMTFGVRYDHIAVSTPEQSLGPVLLAPTRNVTFPAQKSITWNDITPKLGLTYDLFGDGKTAVKASLNKYVAAQTTGAPVVNPAANVVSSTTRSWNDANRNFVPECDLTSPTANGECGAMANAAFGKPTTGATTDPDLLSGWGVRGFNWEFSAGVQREIMPRVAVDVGYFRRWYGNFVVTDNLATTAADYDKFSLTVPADSRLVGGGGYTVTGIPNLNPAKFGVPANNFVTLAENYGAQREHWNGVDINVSARLQAGILVQGGVSTGRTMTDNCEVSEKLPEILTNSTIFGAANTAIQPQQFCHQDTGMVTQVKGLATFTIPKVAVLVSAAFQSAAGPVLAANYNAPNAVIQPSLGRPLSGGAANATINIVEPGSRYGERINQLDMRFGKILKFGATKTSLNLDVYNLTNTDLVLGESSDFAIWRRPTQLQTARFAKISLQFDF